MNILKLYTYYFSISYKITSYNKNHINFYPNIYKFIFIYKDGLKFESALLSVNKTNEDDYKHENELDVTNIELRYIEVNPY